MVVPEFDLIDQTFFVWNRHVDVAPRRITPHTGRGYARQTLTFFSIHFNTPGHSMCISIDILPLQE